MVKIEHLEDLVMSLKERLAAEKEAALTYENISKQVEGILVEAAKEGRSSVLIYLDNENDCKTQFVRYFLTQEGIDFEKAYESYQTTQFPYIDTHMGGASDIDDSKPVTVNKRRFKGIRVFL